MEEKCSKGTTSPAKGGVPWNPWIPPRSAYAFWAVRIRPKHAIYTRRKVGVAKIAARFAPFFCPTSSSFLPPPMLLFARF